MAGTCWSIVEAVEQIERQEPTLSSVVLSRKLFKDAKIAPLADALLAQPDVVSSVYLGSNRLTDLTGAALARYLAASTTVDLLSAQRNRFGDATYVAVAHALRTNTSLRELRLARNKAVDEERVDAAFVQALLINPARPAHSLWRLYSEDNDSAEDDYARLRRRADQIGHPSMQLLLSASI